MSRISEAMERAVGAGWLLPEDSPAATQSVAAALEMFHPAPVHDVQDVRSGPSAVPADVAAKPGARVGSLQRFDSGAESLRLHVAGVVQRIFLSTDRNDKEIRSVMFVGVDGRDNSALVSAAAAEILAARVVGRVCLVDANIGSPSLHACYGQSSDGGLADLIREMAPSRTYARRLAQGGENSLWLVAAGAADGTANAVLSAEAGAGRIRDLVASFDYLIMTAPAVSQDASAASLLGGLVDGVVLVVEANVTRRRVAQAAVNMLRSSGVRVLGTVLNNRTFPIPDTIYRHL